MYLLIRQLDDVQALLDDNLHSNMYLLIQFNYISSLDQFPHLHSNMYLLILKEFNRLVDVYRNLHSNMYLLIPVAAVSPVGASEKFTFQHVSINS